MFTKENTKTAESIRDELRPICKILEKLAKKTQKAANKTNKAHRVAIAWQYPSHPLYAEDAGENSQEIQNTRENNPEKWHEILKIKYDLLQACEIAEKVARLNYHNYLLYFCDVVAYLLRTGNSWAQFYEKKGIETLGEYLRTELKARFYISRDGTGFDAFKKENFYCYFNITICGSCGISGNNWGTYREHEGDKEWEKPTAPKLYNINQYKRLAKELAKLKNDAESKAREHYEKARKTGLIYFIGGLSTPELKTWKMRD